MLAGRVERFRSAGDLALGKAPSCAQELIFAVMYSSLWPGGSRELARTGRLDMTGVGYAMESS